MDTELKICWICGSPLDKPGDAGSQANGSHDGNGHPQFQNDLERTRTRKAERIEYDPSLCRNCNSNVVRPFDGAFERFISWVFENEEAVIRRRIVNLSHIYAETYVESQRNLYKYFAKNFGCRLAKKDIPVPSDTTELIPLENFRTGLRVTFAVNEDLPPASRSERSSLTKPGEYSLPHSNEPWTFIWHEAFDWFTVFYWYNCAVEQELGYPWVADSQYLHLGTLSLSTPGWNSDLIHKICTQDIGK